MQVLKSLVIKLLQGFLIGLANLIPGVSGGTMMVSMGIYDTIIYSISHIFKQFWKSIKTLLPYIIGMGLCLLLLSGLLKKLLSGQYALATYFCFIGMIFGGLRPLLKNIDRKKIGVAAVIAFVVLFAVVICLGIFGPEKAIVDKNGVYQPSFPLNVWNILLLIPVGAVASATMIIPGVSGSMMMMLMGYYVDIISALDAVKTGLFSFSFSTLLTPLMVLLPFAVGIVLGIFFVAKLIEFLMNRFPTVTYCGVLGLVLASPVAILIKQGLGGFNWLCILTFVAGFALAFLIGKLGEKAENSAPARS